MDNTATTTTYLSNTPEAIQHRAWMQEAIQLEKDWIDCEMPSKISTADACTISRDFDVRPDGRWIWDHERMVTRFELAYHITTNRD